AGRVGDMVENTATIVAIELLAAAQGIDFRRPLTSSAPLERAHAIVREVAPHLEGDRYLALDIEAVTPLVLGGRFSDFRPSWVTATSTRACACRAHRCKRVPAPRME